MFGIIFSRWTWWKFGEKFLGVEEGGTLELHGKDKRSWTKLTKTVFKYNPILAEIYKHKVCRFFNLILKRTLYCYT